MVNFFNAGVHLRKFLSLGPFQLQFCMSKRRKIHLAQYVRKRLSVLESVAKPWSFLQVLSFSDCFFVLFELAMQTLKKKKILMNNLR